MRMDLLLPHTILQPSIWLSDKSTQVGFSLARPAFNLPKLSRPVKPTLLIALFDSSPSITGGADPVGWRYAELEQALRHMAISWKRDDVLVCLRHFDIGTSSDVGPLPLGRRTLGSLIGGLRPPPEIRCGTSELGPSLDSLISLTAAYSGYEVAMALFTDFALTDPDAGQVLERLQRFARQANVSAIALCNAPPVELTGNPLINVTQVTWSCPHGIVERSFCAPFIEEVAPPVRRPSSRWGWRS